jgi:RNA 3'-terminal phosphate cyclase
VFEYDEAEIVKKHLTTKLEHLDYEEEYRIVGLNLPDTAFQMGQGVISSVGLGASASKADVERVRQIVNGMNHEVPIYQAKRSSGKAPGSGVTFTKLQGES